jgi:hypothetical protein
MSDCDSSWSLSLQSLPPSESCTFTSNREAGEQCDSVVVWLLLVLGSGEEISSGESGDKSKVASESLSLCLLLFAACAEVWQGAESDSESEM